MPITKPINSLFLCVSNPVFFFDLVYFFYFLIFMAYFLCSFYYTLMLYNKVKVTK